MKPTRIPNGAAKWPEHDIMGGASKAPRAWVFFLSAESDEYGPMTLTAVDERGQARAYHRHGYLPKSVSHGINVAGWGMFGGGALVAMLAMSFLSCTLVMEYEDMGTGTGPSMGSNATEKINTTSSSSTSSGGTSTGLGIDDDGDEDDTLDTPSTPDTPETLDDTPQTLGEDEGETDSDGDDWADPLDDPCVYECMQEPDMQNDALWCQGAFAGPNLQRCVDMADDASAMRCIELCEWSCY